MKRRHALQKFPAFNKSRINFILPYHPFEPFYSLYRKANNKSNGIGGRRRKLLVCLKYKFVSRVHAMHKKLRRVEITR